MTTDPFSAGPGEVPEWATAVPEAPRASRQQRREIAAGVLLVLAGIGLVVWSGVLVVLEVHEILTQPRVMTDGSVVERLAWPLVPAVFGLGILAPVWLYRHSIDE